MPSWDANSKVYRKYLERIVEMYKTRQDLKAYLELILTMVSAIIFVVFAIRPTFLTIAKLYKEKGEKETIIKTLELKRQNLQTAEANYNQHLSEINLLSEVMPAQPKPDELLTQIEGLATQSSIMIISQTINEVSLTNQAQDPEASLPKSYAINLMATGSYEQIYQFTKNLENFRRPLGFNSVLMQISDGDNDEFFGDIISNYTLEVYYYEEK